jgi:hypothetical protein
MPLRAGTSDKVFVGNIRELMHAYARSGRIGNSRPANKAKADKQAVAIAYRKRRTIGHGR